MDRIPSWFIPWSVNIPIAIGLHYSVVGDGIVVHKRLLSR